MASEDILLKLAFQLREKILGKILDYADIDFYDDDKTILISFKNRIDYDRVKRWFQGA